MIKKQNFWGTGGKKKHYFGYEILSQKPVFGKEFREDCLRIFRREKIGYQKNNVFF